MDQNLVEAPVESTPADDIRKVFTISKTAPEEAAKNIDRANLFGVKPDTYAQFKDELDPEADAIERTPATIEPAVASYLKEGGEQVTNLFNEDINKLNWIEKRYRYYKNQIDFIPETQREINDIIGEKFDSPDGKLDEGKEIYLQELNTKLRSMNAEGTEYEKDNMSGLEEFGVDVASATGDLLRSYWENKEILGGSIATGTVIGGGIGLATPIPGGALVGAKFGAIKGFIGGSALVGFIDGFKQTSRSLYNDLSQATDDQGQPLNIDHERNKMISYSAGTLSAIAGGAAGLVFAKMNPFLKKFQTPQLAAKYITKNPALMTKMELFGGVVKSVLAEGGEEAFQEFIQTTAQYFGQMDESEASLMNAIDQATSAENLQKYAYAGAVGMGTAATVQGGQSVIAKEGLQKSFQEQVDASEGAKKVREEQAKVDAVTAEKKKILHAQNNLLEVAQMMKNTKVNELAPHEMSNLNKKLMGLLGVDEKVFFNLEDLRTFANSPEKGAAVRKIIDPDGELTKMAQELNTPIELDKSQVLQIMTEFPEISDYMRITPEGENPFIIRNEAKEFATKLGEAEGKRAEVLGQLNAAEPLTPEQMAKLNDEVLAPMKDSKYFSSREEYLGQSTFKAAEGVMDQKTVDDLSQAHLEARLELDGTVVNPVDKRFDRYEQAQYRGDTEAEIQVETQKLQKEYAIVGNYVDVEERAGEVIRKHHGLSEAVHTELTNPHHKKGFSPYAIDPRKLTEVQKALYLNTEGLFATQTRNLKSRKVFVEGGLHPDEAAQLQGLDDGDQLLKILAETPTKKQIEKRIKNDPLRKETETARIQSELDPTKLVARDEAFSKITNFHLREMEIMAAKNWGTVKRGIIKVMKKVPTQQELRSEAEAIVKRFRIRDLDPRRFASGEKLSQQAALQTFVDGKIEQSFENKGKAALNNELRRATEKAQEKVEKFQNFWKKMNTPSAQQELKDAKMSEVVEGFMNAFKLDGNVKNEKAQESFNKWLKKQVAAGNWVPNMPENLDNTQGSYKDLTVDQYQVMTEMGQFMLHQAKLKNKLLKKRAAENELETAETIAEDIDTHTKAHWKFDPKRAEKKNTDHLSPLQKWKKGTKTAASTVSSIKTIISELDDYKLDGYFHRLIGKPLKEARTGKRAEIFEIRDNDKKIIEAIYGSVEAFKPMLSDYVKIPEFENIAEIGDGEGNVLKSNLLVMLAHMGDPDGKSALQNFKDRNGVALTEKQIMTVLERELSDKDAAFVQNFMVNRFERFKARSFEMHERTTGTRPEMIEGVPFKFKGKVYPGGYYPIKRTIVSDADKAKGFLEGLFKKESDLGLEDEGHFFAKMRTAEMTKQGRMKDRTGSQRPVELDFANVFEFTEEAVHDLHFREFGIDTLKILKNPFNVQNIKSVVGPEKFISLLNGVKDVVSKTTEKETVLFAEEYGWINKGIANVHSLHAIKSIGFNMSSAAIQADSLSTLMLRVGPKTGMYLGKHATKMAQNISNYEHYVKLAQEINPDIAFEQDQIDNAVTKNSYDWMPVGNSFYKNYPKLGKGVARIREMQKKAIDASFYFVRESDKFNKVLTTLAISEQFLAGDVEGYDLARLEKMTDAEKAEAMRSVIQQSIDLSLTAAAPEDRTPLEKNKVANIFVRYWTDRRSRLNSVLAQIDKARGSVKRGDNAKAARQILTLGLAMGSSAAFIAFVRNEEDSIIKRLKGINDGEDALDFAADSAWGFLTAPFDQTLDTIPLIDNMKYQVMNKKIPGDYRNVSTPMFGVLSDMAMGAVVMIDVLKQARKFRTKKMSDTNWKTMLTNAGYLAGGAPTNAMWKAHEALSSNKVQRSYRGLKDNFIELHEEIDGYIKEFNDDPEAKEFIKDLKEYKKTLPTFDEDVTNVLPENAKEQMVARLSGGDWKKYNPETGAAGIYQFTEERWNALMKTNPELGLTENGRVAKDQSQQERAFNFELQDNTRGLMTFEIPVTVDNLMKAHEMGLEAFLDQHNDQKAEEGPVLTGNNKADAINEVIDTEGGFANHKADRGGATKYGVTKKTYEQYMTVKTGAPYKATIKEIRNMEMDTARDIYDVMYWKEIDGDKIKNYNVAHTLLDQAIHSGPETAIKRAQKVLGIPVDGLMGDDTMKAINDADESKFLDLFIDETERYYGKIVKNDKTQKKFAKGWKKRARKLRERVEEPT